MSFASIEGSALGQHLAFPFSGADSIRVGTLHTPMSSSVPEGTYVFTANFDIYSLPAYSRFTINAEAKVLIGSTVIAAHKVNSQQLDSICLTGILFSNGGDVLSLQILGGNEDGETAATWGFSSGSLDLVRIAPHNFK